MKRLITQYYQRWASSQTIFHPNYVWIGLVLAALLFADNLASHQPFVGLTKADAQTRKAEPSTLETLNLN